MTTPLRGQFGQLLAELRGSESRAEVARRLGFGRPALVRLEQGEANATLDRLDELSVGYDVRFAVVAVDHDGHVRGLDDTTRDRLVADLAIAASTADAAGAG